MSITPGTRLGQYEVQDFIGQGAMGLVFRAYHSELERTGAVKVLQAISPDSDTKARFRHEAQAIAQLRHPNIVNVYDFGEYLGTPYMIVEYVSGGSLADRMGSGRLEPSQALKYLRGIAAGLDYAHGVGVIHRDVKPANVLLEKDDTPVLADFGLAKLVQGSSLKSMTGATTGTPAYMAPEQVTGSDVGPAADRYSLATIAYEMLAGVIPFDGQGLMEILYAHVHRDPVAPSVHNTTLSHRVDEVVQRGLARDPAARWPSCNAFVDALAAALAEKAEPVAARTMVMTPAPASTLPLKRAATSVAVAEPAVAGAVKRDATVAIPWLPPVQPAAKKGSRKRPIAFGAAATLVVLLIMGAIWYAARPPAPTLSLSATQVTAGDMVVVAATHVPANQNGTIQLLSAIRNFPFQADGNGDATTEILIPLDIGAGDHLVRICWASTCHASATLHVVDPVALVGPSPVATPGVTPPTAPSARPQPTAKPGPSPIPTPKATPSAKPTPTPTPGPSIFLVSVSKVNGTKVTFHNFPVGPAAVSVCQNGICHPAGIQTAGANTTVTFQTPAGIVPTAPLVAGNATVKANGVTSNSVAVGP